MLAKLMSLWEQAKTVGRSRLAQLITLASIVIGAAEEIAAAIPGDVATTPTEVVIQIAALTTVVWRVVRQATTVPRQLQGTSAPTTVETWRGPTGGVYRYTPDVGPRAA